jgi:hypothetical protein
MIPGHTTVIAGQYIQRYCRLGVAEHPAPTQAVNVVTHPSNNPACSTYTCPSGYVAKPNNNLISCSSPTCTTSDTQTCCDFPSTCTLFQCPRGYTLRSESASLSCSAKTCSMMDFTTCCLYQAPTAPPTVPPTVPTVTTFLPEVFLTTPVQLTVGTAPPLPRGAIGAMSGGKTALVSATAGSDTSADTSYLLWLIPLCVGVCCCIGAVGAWAFMRRNEKVKRWASIPPKPMASTYAPLDPPIDFESQALYQSVTATGPRTMTMDTVSLGPRGGALHTITEMVEVPAGTQGALPIMVTD